MQKVTGINLVLPMSRDGRIYGLAKELSELKVPEGYCLRVYAVIDNKEIKKSRVESAFSKYMPECEVVVAETGEPAPPEFNSYTRRNRICNTLKKAASIVSKDPLTFLVEDDSVLPPDALANLLSTYRELESQKVRIGIISGVQAGRWASKIVGAWNADNVHDPSRIETVPFSRTELISEVDAAGFYCFLTPTKLFKKHDFTWDGECFGPDVTYGISIRKKGYRNFIDWTVSVGHLTSNGIIEVDERCIVAKYNKNANGKWHLESAK